MVLLSEEILLLSSDWNLTPDSFAPDGQIVPFEAADDTCRCQKQHQNSRKNIHESNRVHLHTFFDCVASIINSPFFWFILSVFTEETSSFSDFLPSSMNDFILDGGVSLRNWHFFISVWTKKRSVKKILHFERTDKYP